MFKNRNTTHNRMRRTHQELFTEAKSKLLEDKSVCQENRDLFKKFFEYEEKKLKRINSLQDLDDGRYKTLY